MIAVILLGCVIDWLLWCGMLEMLAWARAKGIFLGQSRRKHEHWGYR